jgi:hypothetical protein
MATAPKRKKKAPLAQVVSLGTEKNKHFNTGLFAMDEILRELQGNRAIHFYREVSENSPVAGASLYAIEQLIRGIKWRTVAGDKSEGEAKRAELIWGMFNDMSISWEDTVTEILSMLTYGWAFSETVFKIRKGPDQANSSFRSKFNDGLVGWRKWVLVPQETRYDWLMDSEGSVEALVQQVPSRGLIEVPITKALHFRTKRHRNHPEGRSLLRSAYFPWVFVKRIMEIEGVGVERDLAGIPMAQVPPEILDSEASASDKAMLTAIKKVVTAVRRNSQEGIVFPMAFDDENNPMFDFKLLATGGMRQFDTGKIIERYERRIALTLLTDFLMMGDGRVGSLALSKDKTSLIGQAISGILSSIASVINRHAIPRIYDLNGWPMEAMSQLVPEDPGSRDLKELGQYLRNLSSTGVITPDPGLEEYARDIAGAPPIDPEFEMGPEELPDPNDPDAEDEEEDGDGPQDPDKDEKDGVVDDPKSPGRPQKGVR